MTDGAHAWHVLCDRDGCGWQLSVPRDSTDDEVVQLVVAVGGIAIRGVHRDRHYCPAHVEGTT